MASLRRSPPDSSRSYGCFLKWWYPQSTSKWSFYSEKPWLLGTTILGNPHICCNASVSPCLSDMWRWSLIISPQEIGNNALPPKSWFSGKMGVSSKIRFLHLKGNFSNWTMMGERYPWWSQTWHAGCQRWLPHPKELVGTTLRDAIVTTRIMRINMPFLVGDPDPNLGGGFKYVLFSPLPGDMIQFDEHPEPSFDTEIFDQLLVVPIRTFSLHFFPFRAFSCVNEQKWQNWVGMLPAGHQLQFRPRRGLWGSKVGRSLVPPVAVATCGWVDGGYKQVHHQHCLTLVIRLEKG